MGLRRLRARLDGGEAKFHNTMDVIHDLVADLQDGFGVTLHLEPHALAKLYQAITNEEGADLPLVIKVNPAVDTQK